MRTQFEEIETMQASLQKHQFLPDVVLKMAAFFLKKKKKDNGSYAQRVLNEILHCDPLVMIGQH